MFKSCDFRILIISGSFYKGQVHVGIKDTIFEASNPWRHAAEMSQLLFTYHPSKKILLLYSDGGGDHNLTFNNVQLSIISVQKKHDYDAVIIARCAPNQSFRNPPERMMSIIGSGFSGVGVMRRKVNYKHSVYN